MPQVTHGLIVQWSSHRDHSVLHGIIARNDGGSMVTACHGRWTTDETGSTFPLDTATKEHRCEACERIYVDQKFIERGLRELQANTFSHIGMATRRFSDELARFNPFDHEGFERWLGPCQHDKSPITRCASCAPPITANP